MMYDVQCFLLESNMVNLPTNLILRFSLFRLALFRLPPPSSTIFCANNPNFCIFMQVLAILAKNVPYQSTQIGNL